MPAHANTIHIPGPRPDSRRRRPAAAASGQTPSSLITWYLSLTPHWMGATPRIKTRILLRTHQWIIERVLAPEVGLAGAAADLRPDGVLTQTLTALVGADGSGEWRHFIQLVVANLRHALLLPVTRRNEAWVRWLFLIPYSIRQTPEASPAPASLPVVPGPARGRSCCEA